MLNKMVRAAGRAGVQAGKDMAFGLNASAFQWYDRERKCYRFPYEGGTKERDVCRTSKEVTAYYEELTEEFPVSSIEDPLDCEDWNGWVQKRKLLATGYSLQGCVVLLRPRTS